jgi:hypothetical protein
MDPWFHKTRFGSTMMDISSEKKAFEVTCLLHFFYDLTLDHAVLLCYLLHHYQGNSSRATCLHSFRCIMERKYGLSENGRLSPSALMFRRLIPLG